MAIFVNLKVAKNGNNWLQIIAKIGKTLSLYKNLSHSFAIFVNILLPKVAKNGIFLLTSKLPKMANEHSSLQPWAQSNPIAE